MHYMLFVLIMAGCNLSTSMQLFQEMKFKFPDIPEEIIQSCIHKYSGDREACIQLLSKENMNYITPSIEANFPTSHYSIKFHSKLPKTKNGNNLHLRNPLFGASPSHPIYPSTNFHVKNKMGGRSISYFPPTTVICNTSTMSRPREIQSAPTVHNEYNPFMSAYRNRHVFNISSEYGTALENIPHQPLGISAGWNYSPNLQSMLAATKPSGHLSSGTHSQLTGQSGATQTRHVTTLKINPQLPYLNEKYSYNSSSSVTTNVMPSGRHMTSVNLQLRPPSLEPQPPIEITSTPLNCENGASNFNSHVQISISSTGATLTAIRTQKKPPISSPLSPQRNISNVPSIHNLSLDPNSSHQPETNGHHSTTEMPTAGIQDPLHLQPISPNLLTAPEPWERYLQQRPIMPHQNLPLSASQSVPANSSHEVAYIQALLFHQRARLEVLQKVLEEERKILAMVKMEVNNMEQNLLQRRLDRTAISNMTDMQNLREETRQLRVECHCLSKEVDLILQGCVPLGETDENFYEKIFTGPTGPIPPASSSEQSKIPSPPSAPPPPSAVPESNIQGEDIETQDIDEKDVWKCSKCTFINHPALNTCEICEMARTTVFDDTETGPTYCSQYHGMVSAPQTSQTLLSNTSTRMRPRQGGGVGHVQISVTQNNTTDPSKGLRLQLTHRYPRR